MEGKANQNPIFQRNLLWLWNVKPACTACFSLYHPHTPCIGGTYYGTALHCTTNLELGRWQQCQRKLANLYTVGQQEFIFHYQKDGLIPVPIALI